jgi:hypothetical protein
MASVEGKCSCGAVRYTVNGGVKSIINCHCNLCRSINGAAFSTYAVVSLADFIVNCSEGDLSKYSVTDGAAKHYCAACGTPIFNINVKYPGLAMLHFGTLASHAGLTPAANIFCESKLSWVDSNPQAKSFKGAPEQNA